jgi:adenylate kinase
VVVLVTGVPGVGKTSACGSLGQLYPADYLHVSFGSLILGALGDSAVSERRLREDPTDYVTRDVLHRATAALQRVVTEASRYVTVLVDSHAVSQTNFGYVANPDGADYFQRIRYRAVIQLYAAPEVVLARSAQQETGRRAQVPADVTTHFALQSSVSMLYSAACDCPLYLVNAERGLPEVVETLHDLISRERPKWSS